MPETETATQGQGAPVNGHGHVVPNADGTRARCGGPGLCRTCAAELQALQSSARRQPPPVRDQLRLCCHELGVQICTHTLQQQAIAAMLAAVTEIDRLQELVAALESTAADAVMRTRQNPDA